MSMAAPIQVNHLFKPLDEKLFDLLLSLDKKDWHLPTIAKHWTVKDITAHLLDTRLRTISTIRDKHFLEASISITSYQNLVNYLNTLNADWVKAMRRISPSVIIELLKASSPEFIKAITSLPPFEQAPFGVAWAGQETSLNWFHVAREYTEQFVHQLQIRDAVSAKQLFIKELFFPFMDTLLQGLPNTFKHVQSEQGTCIQITIRTNEDWDWFLEKTHLDWQLTQIASSNIEAQVIIEPETAWKLFSKGITPEKAKGSISFIGNTALAENVLRLVAVMA